MVMKRKTSKFLPKAFRFAPFAAGLAAMAMVAACARANDKAAITPEVKAKVDNKFVAAALKAVSGYNAFTPENMSLAQRISGASVIIDKESNDGTSVDVKLKIVFNGDHSDLILVGQLLMAEDANTEAKLVDEKTGLENEQFQVSARCASSKCQEITAEIHEMGDKSASTKVVVTPQVNTSAGDGSLGQLNLSAVSKMATGVTAVGSDTASAALAPAPVGAGAPAAQPAPKVLDILAKDVLIFKSTTAKTPVGTDKKLVVTSATITDLTMYMIFCGPTKASEKSGPLTSYEDAYLAKYGQAATPDTTVNLPASASGDAPAAADKVASDKAASDKAASDKAASDKAASDKVASDKAAADLEAKHGAAPAAK